jgi:hypothetical protein
MGFDYSVMTSHSGVKSGCPSRFSHNGTSMKRCRDFDVNDVRTSMKRCQDFEKMKSGQEELRMENGRRCRIAGAVLTVSILHSVRSLITNS